MRHAFALFSMLSAALLAAALAATGTFAQNAAVAETDNPAQTRAALKAAEAQARAAARRGARLEKQARGADAAAEKTARQAAALAARIQEAEAGIQAAEARLSLINGERRQLDSQLARRQEPLVRLTGALQNIARRPVTLSALKPGSLQDAVYLRAVLETSIPAVRQRTLALRSEIDRGRILKREAQQALAVLQSSEARLDDQRRKLAAIETRQRLESRRIGGAAARETERALALAEEARDLDALVDRVDEAGALRSELAALPGPVLRPSNPGNARGRVDAAASSSPAAQGRIVIQLPVNGRTVEGFGEAGSSGVRGNGIVLGPVGAAQVIAPAAGRVAFAGPYRGFARIVIIEHPGDWTSLVTGLARTDVQVGETIVQGAPLGVANVERPRISFELRRGGIPVNPLNYLN